MSAVKQPNPELKLKRTINVNLRKELIELLLDMPYVKVYEIIPILQKDYISDEEYSKLGSRLMTPDIIGKRQYMFSGYMQFLQDAWFTCHQFMDQDGNICDVEGKVIQLSKENAIAAIEKDKAKKQDAKNPGVGDPEKL